MRRSVSTKCGIRGETPEGIWIRGSRSGCRGEGFRYSIRGVNGLAPTPAAARRTEPRSRVIPLKNPGGLICSSRQVPSSGAPPPLAGVAREDRPGRGIEAPAPGLNRSVALSRRGPWRAGNGNGWMGREVCFALRVSDDLAHPGDLRIGGELVGPRQKPRVVERSERGVRQHLLDPVDVATVRLFGSDELRIAARRQPKAGVVAHSVRRDR